MDAYLIKDEIFKQMIKRLPNNELEIYEVTVSSEEEPFSTVYLWDGYIIKEKDLIKIIRENKELELVTIEKIFEKKYAALTWIFQQILAYRNLTPQTKKYLIGKRYESEKMAYGASDRFRGNQYIKPLKSNEKHMTRRKIANETNTSESYVKWAYEFSRGIDAAEYIEPGFKDEFLSGSIKRKDGYVAKIAKVPFDERVKIIHELKSSLNSKNKRGKEK